MANSYNSNPLALDTDFSNGWKANQTLMPSGGKFPAVGIRPFKLILESNGTTAAGTVTIADPNDSTVLWTAGVAAAAGAAGTILTRDDWSGALPAWRDFKITGLTATVTKLIIWYRQ